jgi:hypothetical protein
MSINGCLFIGNFLSIASCFTVAAAADFKIDSCEFRDTSAILGFLSIVTTTVSVNSDGLTYTNNTRKSDATTTPRPGCRCRQHHEPAEGQRQQVHPYRCLQQRGGAA